MNNNNNNNNNNPVMNRKSFLSLMNGGKKVNPTTINNSGQNSAKATSWNLMNRVDDRRSGGDEKNSVRQEEDHERAQTQPIKSTQNFNLNDEPIFHSTPRKEHSNQEPNSKKNQEKDFLSQFLDEDEAKDLVNGKSEGGSIFLEQQKVEEDKLRKMILNVNLEASYLLQKINERSDGRLNDEQIEILNKEVRLREKTRLKCLIANKKLSANLIRDKILVSCLTLDQQKELIEILQNREELNLRNMIDNRFINHVYLLHQIHLTELENEKKQSLLEALSNKVEQRLVSFMGSSYFDIQALLLEVNRLSFDGLLNVQSRQKLIEMLQLKEEEKVKKMIKNPYIESSDLLKEITLRSDGRLSDLQIKSLIGLVRQRL
jgi:hypothetical protein